MSYFNDLLLRVNEQYQDQPLFLQAVTEVFSSLIPALEAAGDTKEAASRLERLLIPERTIIFKVVWSDDRGQLRINTGYRVQFNSALGPYKGGLRFDPSVNEDVLKFLGFEQMFKNALTGLPLGGGKGGSDFDPKGRSDNEIRSFCRSFMTELYRHIGLEVDVPAGDMGVGAREIGYLYGMYKQISNRSEGTLTGKDPMIGGSLGRNEATGHGVAYFARAMLREKGQTLTGLRAVVSGSGNVAEHTARQLIKEGATVLTMSDRGGYLFKDAGLSSADIDAIARHKDTGANLDTLKLPQTVYKAGAPWQKVPADGYFPCATQNEIRADDASFMVQYATLIVEGANMPLTNEAAAVVESARILYAPGKASNAGGVAVSGLEMVQNASHYAWSRDRVEEELVNIMESIHELCREAGREDWGVNYVKGANIAGAKRVLAAMERLGW